MASVTVEEVSKVYNKGKKGQVRAVDRLSIGIEDRELVVLVGPSGCGKTTTLRMVAGLEHISEGTIRIGDRVVNDVAPKDRDIAMVFQNYALYPHMSVFDNMAFGLKMRHVPRKEIRRKVQEAADMLAIRHLLDRKPKALSGGEKQRVAVGRAIVRHPRVFLFDEPLSNLDAKLRTHMRTELKALQRKLATTTIYVTHDQEEAMTLGDRLVIMKGGLMQQCGTPVDVYNSPANRFVAGFFGTPPMNFLEGMVEQRGGGLLFCGCGVEIALPTEKAELTSITAGRQIALGIRAEHLRIGGLDGRFIGERGELPESATAEMIIQIIEPLGDSHNIHLTTSTGHPITARIAPTDQLKPQQTVSVVFDPSRIHLFEPGEDAPRIG